MMVRSYDENYARVAGICVPACIIQLESNIDNGGVVDKLASEKPVPCHETFEMRTDVSNLTILVEVSHVQVIAHS